jgi:hypothetical protein
VVGAVGYAPTTTERVREAQPRRASLSVGGGRSRPGKSVGVADVAAGRLQGSRLLPSSWRLAGLLVLWAFGLSMLNLPVHLVHHLGEVNPDCQLLALSASLNAPLLDRGLLPTIDQTWDELSVPVLSPDIPLLWESAWARAPPPAI